MPRKMLRINSSSHLVAFSYSMPVKRSSNHKVKIWTIFTQKESKKKYLCLSAVVPHSLLLPQRFLLTGIGIPPSIASSDATITCETASTPFSSSKYLVRGFHIGHKYGATVSRWGRQKRK